MRILPSEVRRTRLHAPQKAWVTGAMMPISPTPSGKVIAARCLAGFARRQRHEGHHPVDALDDFSERNNDARRPQAVFFKGHELDEANHHIFFAGKAGKAFDFAVVEAAQQDAVDLERA